MTRHQLLDVVLAPLDRGAREAHRCATRASSFFTFAFPLLFLVLFNGLNGNDARRGDRPGGGKVPSRSSTRPSIGIFGLTMACYTSVIVGLSTARDMGLLKRVRGTPLPMGIYLGSWLTGAVLSGIAAVLLMFAVAVPAFGVTSTANMLPAAVVTLVLGAASLAALGLAVATPCPDRRPGAAGRAVHVPAAVVHLGHLLSARRRAPLAGRRRRLLPALPHRRRLRRLLRAQHAERRLVVGRPRGDRDLGRRRAASWRRAASARSRAPATAAHSGRRSRAASAEWRRSRFARSARGLTLCT